MFDQYVNVPSSKEDLIFHFIIIERVIFTTVSCLLINQHIPG